MSDSITVRDLADAASRAAEVQNRYWLAVVLASLFVLLPRPSAPSGPNSTPAGLSMPFDLGSVSEGWFMFVAALMLSALLISFCTAHAHMVRVQKLIERASAATQAKACSSSPIDPQDLLSALRTPSFSRVAPLVQAVQGKWQFFTDGPVPRWLNSVSIWMYVFLKILAFTVWLGLPASALVYASVRSHEHPPNEWIASAWWWVVGPFLFGSLFAWLAASYLEWEHVVISCRRIRKRESRTT